MRTTHDDSDSSSRGFGRYDRSPDGDQLPVTAESTVGDIDQCIIPTTGRFVANESEAVVFTTMTRELQMIFFLHDCLKPTLRLLSFGDPMHGGAKFSGHGSSFAPGGTALKFSPAYRKYPTAAAGMAKQSRYSLHSV